MEGPPTEEGNSVLPCSWTMWAHLPHDTDWSLASYKEIMTARTVDELVALVDGVPDKLVKNCMLFLMKEGVAPTWEDPKNKKGGCFSYKVANKSVPGVWKTMAYRIAGGTLSGQKPVTAAVNGITVSPKKSFCIMKVWMSGSTFREPTVIEDIDGLPRPGCIFKRHTTG